MLLSTDLFTHENLAKSITDTTLVPADTLIKAFEQKFGRAKEGTEIQLLFAFSFIQIKSRNARQQIG